MSHDEDVQVIIDRIERIELELKETKRELQKILDKKRNTNNDRANTKETHNRGPKDRFGNEIKVGCKVKFLTGGRYTSTKGIVTNLGRSRVTATDKRGNKIYREFGNVQILNDDGDE